MIRWLWRALMLVPLVTVTPAIAQLAFPPAVPTAAQMNACGWDAATQAEALAIYRDSETQSISDMIATSNAHLPRSGLPSHVTSAQTLAMLQNLRWNMVANTIMACEAYHVTAASDEPNALPYGRWVSNLPPNSTGIELQSFYPILDINAYWWGVCNVGNLCPNLGAKLLQSVFYGAGNLWDTSPIWGSGALCQEDPTWWVTGFLTSVDGAQYISDPHYSTRCAPRNIPVASTGLPNNYIQYYKRQQVPITPPTNPPNPPPIYGGDTFECTSTACTSTASIPPGGPFSFHPTTIVAGDTAHMAQNCLRNMMLYKDTANVNYANQAKADMQVIVSTWDGIGFPKPNGVQPGIYVVRDILFSRACAVALGDQRGTIVPSSMVTAWDTTAYNLMDLATWGGQWNVYCNPPAVPAGYVCYATGKAYPPGIGSDAKQAGENATVGLMAFAYNVWEGTGLAAAPTQGAAPTESPYQASVMTPSGPRMVTVNPGQVLAAAPPTHVRPTN